MKNESYTCDRCGKEEKSPMFFALCPFGRYGTYSTSAGILEIGHLCHVCEVEWYERFYNAMLEFQGGR